MRIHPVTLDGFTLLISPLTLDEADRYIAEGQQMLKCDPKPTPEEWMNRTLDAVCLALNKPSNGDGKKWDKQKVRSELDLPMVNLLYREFMSISGLEPPKSGEKQATSTSS